MPFALYKSFYWVNKYGIGKNKIMIDKGMYIMKRVHKLILIGVICVSIFGLFGCSSQKEVTLKIISTFSQDMYVDVEGYVGKTKRDEYAVTVKKGEYIIDGVAKLTGIGNDSITIKLDRRYRSYHKQKAGGSFKVKKGEYLDFLLDNLYDATDSYMIKYE